MNEYKYLVEVSVKAKDKSQAESKLKTLASHFMGNGFLRDLGLVAKLKGAVAR
jgi:hypothetical protein